MKYTKGSKNLEKIYQPDIEIPSISLIEDSIYLYTQAFFEKNNITNHFLATKKITISDIIFNKIDFTDFFYNVVFPKTQIQSSTVGYAITINKNLVNKVCPLTELQFSCIYLYNQPVFYYIYFSIEDISTWILNSLKKSALL
jgi:hypothetical protein